MAVSEFFNAWNSIKKYPRFAWFLFWGQRSNGKTFSVIDGSMRQKLKIAYIRRYDSEIERVDMLDLFTTDHNINEITDNKFNAVTMETGKMYYCNFDEKGKVKEKSEKPFAQCFSINRWEKYKGADRGHFDVIIFDEFMSDSYLPDEYIKFKNMLSTLLRNRENSIIIMLANSFDPFSIYFDELQVNEIVQSMRQGETKTAEFDETKILLHYCKKSNVTLKVNKRFFGFDVNKIHTQMVEGGSWQIKDFPHCDVGYNNKPINSNGDVLFYCYITYRSKIMRLAIVNRAGIPPFIHCYFVDEIPDKAKYIFTPLNNIYDNNTYHNTNQFITNTGKRGKIFDKLLRDNRLFFNTNLEGQFFKTWYDNQIYSNFNW